VYRIGNTLRVVSGLVSISAAFTPFSFFQSDYVSSKVYPMFPRYTMLKDMIKDIMHDPDYMEVCHEVDP
jgi:hypothetical protein